MQRLNFSIDINTYREHVWHALWDDATYRDWTSAFSEGSYAESDWHEGSRVKFLDPGGNGMVAIIETKRPNEVMTFRHIAEIKNGQEQPPAAWSGARESYKLESRGDATRLTVDMETADEYREMFETMFPKALARLKAIAESRVAAGAAR